MTDFEQFKINKKIDDKYAGKPDMGRKLKGAEFDKLKAEYEARDVRKNILLGVAMAVNRKCKVEDCAKSQYAGGFCSTHAKELAPEELARRNAMQSGRRSTEATPVISVAKPAETKKQEEVQHQGIILSEQEHHAINLLQVIRAKKQADLDATMSMLDTKLMDITDPYKKLMFAVNTLELTR